MIQQRDVMRIQVLLDRWELLANNRFVYIRTEDGFQIENRELDLYAFGKTMEEAFGELAVELDTAYELYVEEASRNPERFDSHALAYGRLLKESVRRIEDGITEEKQESGRGRDTRPGQVR